MTVRLKKPVIYRGRVYNAGEPIQASPDMIAVWAKNGLLLTPAATAEPEEPASEEPAEQPPVATAERLTAEGPPGIVEGGTGAEGIMPGRDSRKKKDGE